MIGTARRARIERPLRREGPRELAADSEHLARDSGPRVIAA